MKTKRMERIDWLFNFIMKNPFYFVFICCVIGGVIANEAWLKLKFPERNFYDGIFLKFIVATFLCVLIHAFYSWRKYDKDLEYLPLLLASYLYRSFSKWVSVSLFPILTKIILNTLTKKDQEDNNEL